MKLFSRKDLDDEAVFLTFVGPSGVGKTSRSKSIHKEFGGKDISKLVQIDRLIGQSKELRHELKLFTEAEAEERGEEAEPLDNDTAAVMGRWMGMPWSENFLEREAQYLRTEEACMKKVLRNMEAWSKNFRSILIDTTGSAHDHTMQLAALKQFSVIVYLRPDANKQESLLEKYLRDPKPVCFNGLWTPKSGESRIGSLRRCFRDLLELRDIFYSKYADVIVDIDAIEREAEDRDESKGVIMLEHMRPQFPMKVAA